jgi:hypothetical protein
VKFAVACKVRRKESWGHHGDKKNMLGDGAEAVNWRQWSGLLDLKFSVNSRGAQTLNASPHTIAEFWGQLGAKTRAFLAPNRDFRVATTTDSTGLLEGAAGIELKAVLRLRKLMILRTAKMAKPSEFAEARLSLPKTPYTLKLLHLQRRDG